MLINATDKKLLISFIYFVFKFTMKIRLHT